MDGTFQQYGVFEETGLVRLAANLSYLEGASLSDAAVTAWNALYGLKQLKPGDWVLILGTGGVSLFALQVSYNIAYKDMHASIDLTKFLVCQSRGRQSYCYDLFFRKGRIAEETRRRSCYQLP